jgi:hypothetical protein
LFLFLFCFAFSLSITISRGLHFFSNVCALHGILMLGLDDFIPLSDSRGNVVAGPSWRTLQPLHTYYISSDGRHEAWDGVLLDWFGVEMSRLGLLDD